MLVLQGPKLAVQRIVFAPTNAGLAAEWKGQAHYWPTFDTPNPRAFKQLVRSGFGFSADKEHVLAYTNRGLRVFKPNDPEGVRLPTKSIVSAFRCSPAEPVVAVRMQRDGVWVLWRITDAGEWELAWEGADGAMFPLGFSQDGKRLYQYMMLVLNETTEQLESVFETFDARSGQLVKSVRVLDSFFVHTVISPKGDLIASVCNTEIRLYSRARRWQRFRSIKADGRKHFTDVAFHPNGGYLAVTSKDETVKLYDTATWDVAHTFTWKIGRMRSIAFSPDGALAAAGSDKGQVVVWDVDL